MLLMCCFWLHVIVGCLILYQYNNNSNISKITSNILQDGAPQGAQRAVVFCNKIETCRKVENLLTRAARRAPPSRTQNSTRETASVPAGGRQSWDADRFAYDDAQGGMYGTSSPQVPFRSSIFHI